MNEKILVIDDEEDILQVLSTLLEGEGYEVAMAPNGVVGLELFMEVAPDLVITDVKMPQKDGLDLLKEIKKIGSGVDVIILTGHSDESTALKCLRAGAYDYLLKPLEDIDILIAAVDRALQKRMLESKNRQLTKKLEEMSIRDPLTGLYNSRHLHTCLDDELSRSARYGHPFSLVLFDIDHFKGVDDARGGLFGDHVLKELGAFMKQNFRSADRLFRRGGGAFSVIMPETPGEEALSTCRRFLTSLHDHTFTCDGRQTRISASMGVAVHPEHTGHSNNKTELIRGADKALCQAKEAGRNRAIFGIENPLN